MPNKPRRQKPVQRQQRQQPQQRQQSRHINPQQVKIPRRYQPIEPRGSEFFGTTLIQPVSSTSFGDLFVAEQELSLPFMFQTRDQQDAALAAGTAPIAVQLGEQVVQGIVAGIGIPTGEEIEDYVQEKSPYVVLAVIGIILVLLGVARFIFSPAPVK